MRAVERFDVLLFDCSPSGGEAGPRRLVGLDAPPEKLRSAFAMLLGDHLHAGVL